MSKERINRRELIKRGLMLTAGIIADSAAIANVAQLGVQGSNEVSQRYPFVKNKFGAAANPAGLSCRRVIEQGADNRIGISRSEEAELLQQYQDYRIELFLKNNGIARSLIGLATALVGTTLIVQGTETKQEDDNLKENSK